LPIQLVFRVNPPCDVILTIAGFPKKVNLYRFKTTTKSEKLRDGSRYSALWLPENRG